MAKKAKKKAKRRKPKVSDWRLGQPLDFPERKNPSDINILAREVVEAAIGEPLKSTKQVAKRLREK